MRDIKFRAWNKADSRPEHRIIYDLYLNPQAEVCMSDGDWWKLPLMQYAGLKDKNGKEIYEGDMIEVAWSKSENSQYPVVFESGRFCYTYPTRNVVTGEPFDIWYELYLTPEEEHEVIGNIYENPELRTGARLVK